MEELLICGGRRLCGVACVPGAKNAALPLMAASLMADAPVTLLNYPDLLDTARMEGLLTGLGCRLIRAPRTLTIDPASARAADMPETLAGAMRGSLFLLGPLLSRFGRAELTPPGGCPIGKRPVDYHLRALEELGACVAYRPDGRVEVTASRLTGRELRLPYPSVGATENLMMAACRAEGRTVLENAAREPEILDLQALLNEMGARITGGGTTRLVIEGVKRLSGCEHRIIPDRIIAGSLLAAAAATRGEITLRGVEASHLAEPLRYLRQAGCYVERSGDALWLRCDVLRGLGTITTGPYPAFPTDLQAPFCALALTARGETQIVETVFEDRFHHLPELMKMGAQIARVENRVFLTGGELHGAAVEARDLRGGMALIIAALAARGESRIRGLAHIDRGYESVDNVFSALGALISRKEN